VTAPLRPPALDAVLETTLYYGAGEEAAMERFYSGGLGLRRISGKEGLFLAFRLGPAVLLLFDRNAARRQTSPPPHGSTGPGHVCFVVSGSEYGAWKSHLTRLGVLLQGESEWPSGGRSFYFSDPAGNTLEIADRDIWPP